MLNELINTIIGGVITVLAAVITTVLLPAASAWIQSKIENEKINGIINDLSKTAATSVDMLEQTMVKQLKADGKWDTDAQKEVLCKAVSETINSLAYSTKSAIESEDINITDIVVRYVEAYIQSKKAKQSK